VGVAVHLDESMPRPRPSSSVLGFKTNRNAEEAESIQDKQKGKDIKVKSKQCLTGHTFRPTGGVHRQLPCSRGHLAMPWHTHHTLASCDHPCIVVLPRADAGRAMAEAATGKSEAGRPWLAPSLQEHP